MPYPSGNATFDATVTAAESTRQVAVAAASTQVAATAAVKTYLSAVIAAGIASTSPIISVPNEVTALNAINASGNP